MTNERFRQIEQLVEDAGKRFDPATGQFEAEGDGEKDLARHLDPLAFMALLGITEDEGVQYVQRKTHDYDESLCDTR